MKGKKRALFAMLKEGGRPELAAALLFAQVLCTVRDVACLVTLVDATDCLLYGGENLTAALVWMAAAMFAGTPVSMLMKYLSGRYRIQLQCALTEKLSGRLEETELSWLEEQSGARLLSICTADLNTCIRWATWNLPELVRVGTYTVAVIIYCMGQSLILTLCFIPVIIAVMPLVSLISRPLKEITDRQRESAAESLKKVQETLRAPEFVKAYGLEEKMDSRMDQALAERRRQEEASAVLVGLIDGLIYFASYLPGLIAVGAGAIFMLRGELTAGFLVGFVQTAVQRFGGLVPQLGGIVTGTRQASASAELLMEILDAPVPKAGKEGNPEDEQVIRIKKVSFAYPGGKKVLKEVSLTVKRREFVALVGESGCGKSTLLKLLMGVYPEYDGEFLVEGLQVREWDKQALRGRISPVFQQPFLFPMTIGENLGVAPEDMDTAKYTVEKEEINDITEKAWQALSRAELADFVRELPDGLDTNVSEQGASLSGGQNQRMTIARAFFKDAPLIVMDEPTSALDSVTESGLQRAFERLRNGKTAVVVAHRLSTIQNADRIYVMEKGRIVQQGVHQELIAREGAYRKLYESQLTPKAERRGEE